MPIVSVIPNANSVEKTTSNNCSLSKNLSCKHSCLLKEKSNCKSLNTQQHSKKTSLLSRQEDDAWVDISTKRLRSSRLGALYDGSRFKGMQKCGANTYNVIVDIQVMMMISRLYE